MTELRKDGLERMLEFLNFLREKNVEFKLDQDRPSALLVTFGFPGARVEAEFFPDHIEYSFFNGDESVENDETALRKYVLKAVG